MAMASGTAPSEPSETDKSPAASGPPPQEHVSPDNKQPIDDSVPSPPGRLSTIGLALSGGGFRATLFHLGVIRYLRSEDLLGQIKVICSVSGGSVLAAHLVLNWNKWSGSPEDYEEAEEEIRNFVTFGLRERIVRRLPLLIIFDRACMLVGIAVGMFIGGVLGLVLGDATWQFIGGMLGVAIGGGGGELIGVGLRRLGFHYTETNLLDREYRKQLYKSKCLKHLSAQVDKGAPSLCLMTTNLTRHDGLCYFSERGFFVDSNPDVHEPVTALSTETLVSRAVAASSAYPGLFRPLGTRKKLCLPWSASLARDLHEPLLE
jgi:Patatin-like phospholipase